LKETNKIIVFISVTKEQWTWEVKCFSNQSITKSSQPCKVCNVTIHI